MKLRDGSGTLHDVDDNQTQEVEKGWMANFACSDAFGIVGDSTIEKHMETDFNRQLLVKSSVRFSDMP